MKGREIKVVDSAADLPQAVSTQQARMPIIAAKEASVDDKVRMPLREEGTAREAFPDPTFRINRLKAANQQPIYIAPDQQLRVAVTSCWRMTIPNYQL